MELFRWSMRTCLLLVAVTMLLPEHGQAKVDSQHDVSEDTDDDDVSDSLPAEKPASGVSSHTGHGHQRRQHQAQHDHDHHHNHRQAHHGSRPQRRKHAKHHTNEEPDDHPRLPHPHALSRNDDGEAHDVLDCQPQQGDRLLARSVVKAEFRPLGFADASWFYPQNGRDQRTVHCVRVLDQRRDGYGGYPKIVRGGVGHHYVDLSFKSDFSRGFHFVIEVYGQ